MRKIFTFAMLFAVASPFFAQKAKTLKEDTRTVTYSMAFGDDVSPAKAKATVLEQAHIEAVAAAFGTMVHSSSSSSDISVNGKLKSTFSTMSESDVKGEWLEDVGEPKWTVTPQGPLTEYSVTVKSRVREWSTDLVDLDILLLRNGLDKDAHQLHDYTYYNGDNIYLYFKSPQAGYMAVYLTEELGEHKLAQRLLPYPTQGGEAYEVAADEEYYFFSKDKAKIKDRRVVVPYKMGCNDEQDVNKLYVIFSPNRFVRAADAQTDETMPSQLSLSDFHRWLSNRRRHDVQTQVQPYVLTIKRK